MNNDEKIATTLLIIVICLFTLLILNTHRNNMMAHVETGYVVGYVQKFAWLGDVPITVVTYSYKIIDLNTDDEPIVKTKKVTYGGHYDFEIGSLYKVYSVGNFGWLYRSIFSADIIGPR